MELKGSRKLRAKDRAEKGQKMARETKTQKYTYLSTVHGLDDLFICFWGFLVPG